MWQNASAASERAASGRWRERRGARVPPRGLGHLALELASRRTFKAVVTPFLATITCSCSSARRTPLARNTIALRFEWGNCPRTQLRPSLAQKSPDQISDSERVSGYLRFLLKAKFHMHLSETLFASSRKTQPPSIREEKP